MDVMLLSGIYCFLGFILSASCEEIRTCIPRPTSTIESCHSFSITCPKDTYIGFHHLMYHWSDCLSRFNCNTRDKCCDTTKSDCQTEFSMLDTYRTYIKCSGKEHCIETSLDVSPLRPEAVECFDQNEANKDKTMVPLFMSMTYDCIPFSRVINICDETTKEISLSDENVHFMYKHGSPVPAKKEPTQCTCSISFNGRGLNPTLAYQDIRLYRKYSSDSREITCSSVHLSVSTSSKLEERHCTSTEPVSSFYVRKDEVVDSDVEITIDHLFDGGPQDEPDMVWLSLKAYTPVTVICGSKNVAKKLPSTGTNDDDEDLDSITTIVVPAVCAAIVLASLLLVFFVFRRKKRSSSRRVSVRSGTKRTSVRTIDGDMVEGIYDTIDDFSTHGSSYKKSRGYSQGYTDGFSASPVYDTASKHLSDYNRFATSDDEYNRINLRSKEIIRASDYSRFSSDTDSGVGDSFGNLQTSKQTNGNDSEIILTVSDKSRRISDKNTYSTVVKDSKDHTVHRPHTDLNRKDSYETVDIRTETEHSTKEDREVNYDKDSVRPEHQEQLRRKDSYEIPEVQYNVDAKPDKTMSDYEKVPPGLCSGKLSADSTSSKDGSHTEFKGNNGYERNDVNVENQSVEIKLPCSNKNSADDSDSDSD